MANNPLVTVALPVFNGADTIAAVSRSVLAQDYGDIELLISDNASTDETEDVCQELARSDERVRYHRQPRNVGLINNFEWTKQNCRGAYLRWIGDNDELHSAYVSQCLSAFEAEPHLVLVTTQIEYSTERGAIESVRYDPTGLHSGDPVDRLAEMLDLLTRTYLLLDPIYGLVRVETARSVVHDQMVRGDEVYAAKLALAGPWGHVPEILARRNWAQLPPAKAASLLEVPAWQARAAYAIQLRRLLSAVDAAELTAAQRRRARTLVVEHYVRRHWAVATRRARKLVVRPASA